MTFRYPTPERVDVRDTYGDVVVPDPYRWLEDPDDPRTAAFVAAQNELSSAHLESIGERAEIRAGAERLWDVPRSGAPVERSGSRVRTHNDGLRPQPIFLVSENDGPERVLLDPNTLSDDGATAVIVWSLSPDGRHLAYSIADGGSDWQVVRVRRTEDGTDLDDELRFVKFSTIAWHGDGFFYTRFPAQDIASTGHSTHPRVMHHVLGTGQDRDVEWYRNDDEPERGYSALVFDDILVLEEWVGTSTSNGVLICDITSGDWRRLRDPGEAKWEVAGHVDGRLIVLTDADAPLGRVVAIDPEVPDDFTELVAEAQTPAETIGAFAGLIVLRRLVEAAHTIEVHDETGRPVGSVDLPAPGSVMEWDGSWDEPRIHLQFQSFAHPPAALRWSDGATETVDMAAARDDVVVERHHVPSTDGALVGLFLVRLDGAEPGPTELYGYGGFNISVTPTFNPGRLAFLEAGGAVAVANLRGGAEHGEEWHQQGMLGRKQQVFDDFVACARHLKARGLATAVGSHGRSNGGLLTAATVLQAPDAFDAVVSGVPVIDMLRYQHFTAGRYWTVEYGDASDPAAFDWLIRYSPYHRADDVSDLPPLLVYTAEGDDRVVPMHSYKFAAALQHAAGGESDQPILLRVETRAGHGLGKPTAKLIDEAADIWGFLLHHLRRA